MLITKIPTGISTQYTKSVNVNIEHYHSRDQSVATSAMSFSSSLSDNKESKRRNMFASP